MKPHVDDHSALSRISSHGVEITGSELRELTRRACDGLALQKRIEQSMASTEFRWQKPCPRR